ncbi:MAG TPA: acyl-CoA dehydratase activase-related protein [Thermotogota bacterium]|nr:acyl-CoA dehydratase activase-related protein [Thermotogota bacterium]HPJ88415.1 acyl-CoA dehydratase activase-related protein [Thermotogota bacterium]HPR95418.1 acyl-CoA dehydratase activase-related protein [Thermotogota bacterium]
MKKIGIPHALLYWYYVPFFRTLFEELGYEVVISKETTKNIVNEGIKYSVPELCAPIKIHNGHVSTLLDTDVDYVFIPRFVSLRKYEVFCPKFMGLPDLSLHSIPNMEKKMLTCDIQVRKENIADIQTYQSLMETLGIEKKQFRRALKAAEQEWTASRRESLSRGRESLNKKDSIHIGLMGYVYNVYDKYLSMDITKKLEDMGIVFTTFEMIEEKDIYAETAKLDKELFWTFSNKVLGAGLHLIHNNLIDGLIHITAFGCGPDSFLGKIFEIESGEAEIPFLTIRIDEHSGENHLITRVEAFVDMLKRKKSGVFI